MSSQSGLISSLEVNINALNMLFSFVLEVHMLNSEGV